MKRKALVLAALACLACPLECGAAGAPKVELRPLFPYNRSGQTVKLSPDRQRLACELQQNGNSTTIHTLMVDDLKFGPLRCYPAMSFSSNSRHFLFFSAQTGKKSLYVNGAMLDLEIDTSATARWVPGMDAIALLNPGRAPTKFIDIEGAELNLDPVAVLPPTRDSLEKLYVVKTELNEKVVRFGGVDSEPFTQFLDMKVDLAKQKYYYVLLKGQYDSKYWVVVNGTRSKDYASAGNVQVTEDWSRYGFWVKLNEKQFAVVVDGRQGPPSESLIELGEGPKSKLFTPDGRKYAYQIYAKWQGSAAKKIIIDGMEARPPGIVDGMAMTAPIFAETGSAIAYLMRAEVRLANGSRNSAFHLVLDNKPVLLPCEPRHGMVLSPDGRRYACVLDSVRMPDGKVKSSVFLDGKVTVPYDKIRADTLCFSPDSKHYAYVVTLQPPNLRAGSCVIVVDGKELPEIYDFPIVRHGDRENDGFKFTGPNTLTGYFPIGNMINRVTVTIP